MPASRIADALFNSYHRRILELLLLNASESFHVREIARRSGVPTGSLHRELTKLAEAGLLRRTQVGNQVHYQVDRACPVLKELTATFRKLASYMDQPPNRDIVRTTLKRLNVKPNALAEVCRRHHVTKLSFFGSVTREDFTRRSDVDVLVEFKPDRRATLADMTDLREQLSMLFGGRRVDVATQAIMKNPYRREAIEKDLQTAYAVVA